MEPFSPLSDFYEAIENDARIGVTHISLYMALLHEWNLNGGNNPISISRFSIMKSSKINARYTYNRHMNDLHVYGYITYLPSSNQFNSSIVFLKVM